MAKDNAFFLTRIECPICKTVNEFETVRVGAYAERGRDTDFCPLDIKWHEPRYQAYNPLAFFTATCSNCFYTREYNSAFRDWQKDSNFKMYRLRAVKDRHLEHLAASESIIKSMGQNLDLAHFPNETAVLKLFLAIFDEQLADRPHKLDLGRFYLRIGWVFRELEKGENPAVKVLRSLLEQLHNRQASLSEAAANLQEELTVFSNHIAAHFETDEVPTPIKAQMLPFKERFSERISTLEAQFDPAGELLSSLTELLKEYQSTLLGSSDTGDSISFGGYSSFVDYLESLRPHWDGIVTNEQEALRRAVSYYQSAFEEAREIAPGYQQIQASYLIAELSRRTGDHDTARQYFNATIKQGQEFIYQNRNDRSRTALARKILELAMEQGRENIQAIKGS
jgi:uncharacterized protein (DUF2225 family)